ncbi:alanine racemase [Rhodopseudomonas palustris]|uniref:alanine racemase n=1 Tax=Rhodopseudomonas palustris TaxID=1076 RepID=UPI002ACDE108|nr:alanine racemase [Rhodopseudomonas palustris]WQG97512.1 alanine racemase [Rhodopseudomonas palustris]
MSVETRSGHRHAGATLTVDLAAIQWNYRCLADMVGAQVRCGGVVKADAYGLGARQVAPALYQAGCRDFYVAHLDEALALRPYLPSNASIAVLNGLPCGGEDDCAEAGILPVLNSLAQLDAWSACARRAERVLGAVVQIDCGMSRLGLSPRELGELSDARLRGIDVRLVMSHLACADVAGHAANAYQRARFCSLADRFAGIPKSLANSSGIFLGPDYHHDAVRPGAALYGINPTPSRPNPMRPVVRLSAAIVQTREIEAGDHVGYGWDFRAARPSRLATLSIGYADGLHRALARSGVVYAEGCALAIAGRVSMDSITVDLGELSAESLARGAEIELIGPHQSVDELASASGTIGYEILTGLGDRYRRIYRDAADRPQDSELRKEMVS